MKKIIILLACLLLLVGCAGNASSPHDAKAIALNACQMLDAVKGYRFTIDVAMDPEIMGISVTLKAKGVIRNPDFCYFNVTLPVIEKADASAREVYRQDNKIVRGETRDGKPAKWELEKGDLSDAMDEIFTPFYKTVDGDKFLRNARLSGTETVNGTECHKIEALIDAEDLKNAFSLIKAMDEKKRCPPGTGDATKAVYRFWVAKDSGELCKTQRTIEYLSPDTDKSFLPPNKVITLDITTTLSDHHKDIKLEIPAEVQALLKDNPGAK
ncbi:MAG: hypothetical protein HZA49_00735 [Planctomycetes bacterium]|nr:hypothetical protein [Planctomycetota bacterium]